jgi:hypothetical protein
MRLVNAHNLPTAEIRRKMRELFSVAAYEDGYLALRKELMAREQKREQRRRRYLRSARRQRREAEGRIGR